MNRSAVLLARCLAFVETYDLAPDGRVFFPDVAKELVARYQFQKFPTEFSQFDETKGIEFLEGKRGTEVIQKLTIYNNGILLDTRTDTGVSKEIIGEMLDWGKATFGLRYKPEMVTRYGYVSQVTFYSEGLLRALNPALNKLAADLSATVSQIQKEQIDYQVTALVFQHDLLKRKTALAGFTIIPRIETPLSEGKFFSEAPVPTDVHWNLLEQLENALKPK